MKIVNGVEGKVYEEQLRALGCSAQRRGAEGRPDGGCSSSQERRGSAEICSL